MKLSQTQLNSLKKEAEDALKDVLPKVLAKPLHIKTKSSVLWHEPLMPEGDEFKISMTFIVYPQKEKKPE